METNPPSLATALRTPRSAAAAGVLFALLYGAAMTFVAAAVTAGLAGLDAQAYGADGGSFAFGARVAFDLANVYAVRMAGVFMISLATLCLRTGALPRGLVWLSYALAALLLLSIGYTRWVALVFPLWVLALSVYLLVHGLDAPPSARPGTRQ